jgi:hypothetical protein
MIALKLLQKWKLFIFDLGKQKLNFFFRRNGKITESFRKRVMQNNLVCGLYHDLTNNKTFKMRGELSFKDFYAALTNLSPDWRECGYEIAYTNSSFEDESRFGDPFSLAFCSSGHCAFPLLIHADACESGRGTIGSIVQIMYQKTYST